MSQVVAYVLGTESSGKSDLVRQVENLSKGEISRIPVKCTPTMGQEVTTLNFTSGKMHTSLELRELGGSVVNTWESFIVSRKAKDTSKDPTTFCMVYVVDATAPHQLPLAAMMYRYLMEGSEAVCAGWKSVIVLQKCASLNAMTKEEALTFFRGEGCEDAHLVMEVDSWNGVGIGDVLRCLKRFSGLSEAQL